MGHSDPPILDYGVESSGPGYRSTQTGQNSVFTIEQYAIPGQYSNILLITVLAAAVFLRVYCNIPNVAFFTVFVIAFLFWLKPNIWVEHEWHYKPVSEIHTIFDGKHNARLRLNPIVFTITDLSLRITPYEGIEGTGVHIPLDQIEDLWIEREPPGAVGMMADFSRVKASILLKDGRMFWMKLCCNQSADLTGLELKIRCAIGIGPNPSHSPTRDLSSCRSRIEIVNKPGQIYLRNPSPWKFRKNRMNRP